MKKIIFILLIFSLALGGASYFWLHSVTQKILIPKTKTSSTPDQSIQYALENKKPINILLLGYGGGLHDGTYLTDSLITIHIDPKSQKVFLISIPRDIWVNIPTDGTSGTYSKINAAYSIGLDNATYPNKQKEFSGEDGGGKLAEYVVSHITGLPLDFFISMDFNGFTHTIDTLGGIDLSVEKTFDDFQYPITGKEDDSCGHNETDIASISAQLASSSGTMTELDAFPCRFEHLHFNQGAQHMDGTTALKYVRSRHSLQDGTDFGRAQRQRNLLLAVKQKVLSAGFIPEIIPFISSLGDDLHTDLKLEDIKTFLQNFNSLNKYQIVSLAITDQNYLIDTVTSDGQDVLEPKKGIDDWSGVRNWLKDEFNGISQPVASIVQIENGTSTVGLAQSATNLLLKENSLEVLTPISASDHNHKVTVITVFDKNIKKSDIELLKKEFKTNSVTYTQSGQKQYNVLVTLGYDYVPKSSPKK